MLNLKRENKQVTPFLVWLFYYYCFFLVLIPIIYLYFFCFSPDKLLELSRRSINTEKYSGNTRL